MVAPPFSYLKILMVPIICVSFVLICAEIPNICAFELPEIRTFFIWGALEMVLPTLNPYNKYHEAILRI
ncbi:Uncharacterized protein FWK35_00021780 [Aphis craccivora]|uniref:Uncharacterized protein n=1 Tax=Aphis craccivora TaxID=307492 RepID=A0A6G0YMH5_APHCR|nr:Uncharacterized protein FWK35_00021780 [Aphis craccivora]